jgi:hypothetical protein
MLCQVVLKLNKKVGVLRRQYELTYPDMFIEGWIWMYELSLSVKAMFSYMLIN